MTAALGCNLVFEHDAGESRSRVALHRALDVLGAAESGVAVADQRDLHRATEIASLIDELGVRDEPRIRHSETRGRNTEAAHEAKLEAGFLNQTRRHRVVAAGHHEQTGS